MIQADIRRKYFANKKHQEITGGLEGIKTSLSNNLKIDSEKFSAPMEKMGKTTDNQLKLTLFLIASLRDIRDKLNKLTAAEDVSSIKDGVSNISTQLSEFHLPEFPQEISLNPGQVQALSDSINNIKIPEPLREITVKDIDVLINEFKDLKKLMSRPAPEAPKISKIEGKVEVVNLPKVQENKMDFTPLTKSLDELKLLLPSKEINLTPLTSILEEINTGITDLKQKEEDYRAKKVEVTNFPIQKTPQPVTHISINALHGVLSGSLVTITTSPTPIPATALSNRRSMFFYNGSVSTVYIGGSDVASSGANQGFPVFTSTTSPTLDASKNLILYGIVASGTAIVNVLEISDENSGR